MLPGFAVAQTASGSNQSPSPTIPSGQVPAPTVSFSNSPRSGTGDLINLAVNVKQGTVCSTTWSGGKSINPATQGTVLSEGFQAEISATVANVMSHLEINLGSFIPPSAPGIFINTQYGTIPISLCNASSLNLQVGNVTYINGLPTITNTMAFNDIALPTYGQGSSSITFTIAQTVIADWTSMVIKIGVYADLSNMTLYMSNGTPMPQNTDFSFNVMYQIDMNNGASQNPIDYPPSDITSTSVYFAVNNTAGTQISIANII